MRKILAAALAALQLLFIGGLIAYQGIVEKNLSEKGTQYEFAAVGNYWVIGDDRRLSLQIRKSAGYVYYTENDRYWELRPLTDGRWCVRGTKTKPQDAPYIAIPDRDDWDKVNLSVSLSVTEEFEQRYFPEMKQRYYRENGMEPDSAYAYGIEDVNDGAYGNTFSIVATVWKGHVRFDGCLVNGESLKNLILPDRDR